MKNLESILDDELDLPLFAFEAYQISRGMKDVMAVRLDNPLNRPHTAMKRSLNDQLTAPLGFDIVFLALQQMGERWIPTLRQQSRTGRL